MTLKPNYLIPAVKVENGQELKIFIWKLNSQTEKA